ALQTHHGWDVEENISRVLAMAAEAADRGAELILPSELVETPYFCKSTSPRYRDLARPAEDHPTLDRFAEFARAREVVMPVSFYERAGTALYNSVAVIDADGEILGTYRKCHIPEFEAYHEDLFFTPSPDGPQVWRTRYLTLGVGICWDQWFPELARSMALMGAELLVYPSAIGSETYDAELDTAGQWRAAMAGHAAVNLVPVLAANRVGRERDDGVTLDFYGTSFCLDHRAEVIADAGRNTEAVMLATLDLDQAAADRALWGTFQTRQPRHYGALIETPAGPPPAP
ncbi:MAG: nitrilase-related carbon-nitrogen hydrolase, partial [Pseudomonadota bacterium]